MHVVIAWVLAGVAAASGAGAIWLAVRRARRLRPPSFEVTPAIPYCRVRAATAIAAAWRASGLDVVVRRARLDVRSPEGARAVVELPASRQLGDAPFVIRSHHAGLVCDLAVVASRELGPLVCAIDGYVHGFDLAPEGAGDRAPKAAPQFATGAITVVPPRARAAR